MQYITKQETFGPEFKETVFMFIHAYTFKLIKCYVWLMTKKNKWKLIHDFTDN